MGEEALVAEVEERAREGAKGIKLHPANQRFYPNDRRFWPAYARAQELGMSIITHSGALALLDDPEHHDHPRNFRDVLRDFPRMNLVFAHMCRGFWDEVAEVMQAFPNAYLDTSGAISGIPNPFAISDEEAMTMIRRVGPDRVLFASDWPWHHPIKDSRTRRPPAPERRGEAADILREREARAGAVGPMDNWRFLDGGWATGARQMAVDDALLTLCGRGQSPPTLRLFGFRPACLSLGRFQPADQVPLPPGLDLVRRPTGGGAVVHRGDVCYSIVLPLSHPLAAGSIRQSYQRLARGLAAGLEALGLPPLAEGEASGPSATQRLVLRGDRRLTS